MNILTSFETQLPLPHTNTSAIILPLTSTAPDNITVEILPPITTIAGNATPADNCCPPKNTATDNHCCKKL